MIHLARALPFALMVGCTSYDERVQRSAELGCASGEEVGTREGEGVYRECYPWQVPETEPEEANLSSCEKDGIDECREVYISAWHECHADAFTLLWALGYSAECMDTDP